MEIRQCYQYTGPKYERAIYRVVGQEENQLTLLRVSNDQFMRRHTGEIIYISGSEVDQFTETVEPEKENSRVVKTRARMIPYEVLTILRRLKRNRLLSTLSFGLVIAGFVADSVSLGRISAVLILMGSIGISVSTSGWYHHRS